MSPASKEQDNDNVEDTGKKKGGGEEEWEVKFGNEDNSFWGIRIASSKGMFRD